MGVFFSCWASQHTPHMPPNRFGTRNLAEAVLDGAKDVADGRAEQRKDRDHDDRNQHQDKRVLDETLAFFAGIKQRDVCFLRLIR